MDEVRARRAGCDCGEKVTPRRTMSIGDLVGEMGRRAPFDYAESWDNVGFLAGDAAEELSGVVVAVNLGPEALAAAQKTRSNAIVCHHPPIFKPISRLTRAASPYLYEAIRSGFSVVALHTNFDLAAGEVAEEIAARLGLGVTGFLAPRGSGEPPQSLRLGKFVTYVPPSALDKVRKAVCSAGGGGIANYEQCSFSSEGEGTFFGHSGTDPAVGAPGRLERVSERRLEIVFPWKKLEAVVEAARNVHPYEDMAYDVLELAQLQRSIGYGFIGEDRSTNLTFHKLLDGAKQAFQLNEVTVVGPGLSEPTTKIRRVAFSPGSGSAFVGAAAAKGVDAYICGEVGYHQMLEARQKGVTLVLLGHSYSERFFVETVSKWCSTLGATEKVFETVHAYR